MSELDTWVIESENGQREWQAVGIEHAIEQHWDAFPDENIYGAWMGRPKEVCLLCQQPIITEICPEVVKMAKDFPWPGKIDTSHVPDPGSHAFCDGSGG